MSGAGSYSRGQTELKHTELMEVVLSTHERPRWWQLCLDIAGTNFNSVTLGGTTVTSALHTMPAMLNLSTWM